MSGFVNGGGLEAYPEFRRGVDSMTAYLDRLFRERIVIYDGAMGTMIQKHRPPLTEEDYRVSYATYRGQSIDSTVVGSCSVV
jgi:hypothetical protein